MRSARVAVGPCSWAPPRWPGPNPAVCDCDSRGPRGLKQGLAHGNGGDGESRPSRGEHGTVPSLSTVQAAPGMTLDGQGGFYGVGALFARVQPDPLVKMYRP